MKYTLDKFNNLSKKEQKRIIEVAHYSLINDRHILEEELNMDKEEWTKLFLSVIPSSPIRGRGLK